MSGLGRDPKFAPGSAAWVSVPPLSGLGRIDLDLDPDWVKRVLQGPQRSWAPPPDAGASGRSTSGTGPIGEFLQWAKHPFQDLRASAASRVDDAATLDAQCASALLQGLSDAIGPEMALLDENGIIIAVNAAWRAALIDPEPGGMPGGVGAHYLDVCHCYSTEFSESQLRRRLSDLFTGRIKSIAFRSVVHTQRGERWQRVRIAPLPEGSPARWVAIYEDLAEPSDRQAALQRTAEDLLKAREEERQRIAIELHDSTSQHLVALSMSVSHLRRVVDDNPETRELLDDMSKMLSEVVKEIRVLSYLMKPPGLERDGLETSVRSFVKGFIARTGIRAELQVEGDVDDVTMQVRHAAFRLLQEATANVYRHAQASHVEIGLSHAGGQLTVRVADDGVGIPALRGGDPRGFTPGVGVIGMQTRVSQLGGSLRIEPGADGRGTVIVAAMPASPEHGPLPVRRGRRDAAPAERHGRETEPRSKAQRRILATEAAVLRALEKIELHRPGLTRARGGGFDRST